MTSEQPPIFIKKSRWALALGITCLLVVLDIVFLFHSGGFWSDEVNTIKISTSPTLAGLFSQLKYDRFPLLSFLFVRLWTDIFGTGTVAIRSFGLMIGLAMIGAIWLAAWKLYRKPPVFSLALVCLSGAAVPWLESIRAHGLGAVLILLSFVYIGMVIESPTKLNIFLAALFCIGSVQTLFQNAFLVLPVCAAAMVICLGRDQRKRALVILGIGGASALSLIPYIPMLLYVHSWNSILEVPFTFNYEAFLASSITSTAALWIFVATCTCFMLCWKKERLDPSSTEWYTVAAAGASIVSLCSFMFFLKDYSMPWYFLGLAAITAISVEMMLYSICAKWEVVYVLGILIELFVILISFHATYAIMSARVADYDLIEQYVAQHAAKNDLALMSIWDGIPYEYYYANNPAPFATLPNISDHSIHRYDLVQEKMKEGINMGATDESIERTLENGNSIWFVGDFPSFADATLSQDFLKGTSIYSGSFTAAYDVLTAQFLKEHCLQSEQVPEGGFPMISSDGATSLWKITGWK
jgi:hypothetical protein